MAKGDWWFKFEIHKWLDDPKLRRLSRANRDSWLTALCMMTLEGTDKLTGTINDLANLLHLTMIEFYDFYHDLERSGAADVTRCHGDVTDGHEIFTLISRRLRKGLSVKEGNRLRKQKQREDEDVPPESQDRVRSKKKEVKKEKERREEDTPKTASTKGKRIPDPFLLTAEMKTWAIEKRPTIDSVLETEKFVNYWRAKTGRDATKLDWLATWRNWILSARENGTNKQNNNGTKTTSTDRLGEYGSIIDQYPTEAELRNRP